MRNWKRFEWALLLLVPILAFAVMLPIARERRRAMLNQEFLRAANRLKQDEMKELLAKGANVNGVVLAGNGNDVLQGKTALHIVCDRGHTVPLMRFLVEQGADINARDTSGYTPLITAAASGSWDNVKYLIEAGADLNLKTNPEMAEDELVVKRRTALSRAKATLNSKRARIYGMKPQLKETIKFLDAAGAKE